METTPDLIILGCWIIFIAYWIASAFGQKKIAERQSVWSALAHRIPLGISYMLLVVRRLPPPMNLTVTPHLDWIRIMGDSICALGLLVTLWARRTLAGNWSGDVTFKKGHELIMTGPYRYVRHPIYTGLLVMALGTALEIGLLRCWIAVPLMTFAFWIKITQEEQVMLRHFPDTYPAYRRCVKALVPFVI